MPGEAVVPQAFEYGDDADGSAGEPHLLCLGTGLRERSRRTAATDSCPGRFPCILGGDDSRFLVGLDDIVEEHFGEFGRTIELRDGMDRDPRSIERKRKLGQARWR